MGAMCISIPFTKRQYLSSVQFESIRIRHFQGNSMMICVTDWVENIVGKGENAGYQHFVLFPQCF